MHQSAVVVGSHLGSRSAAERSPNAVRPVQARARALTGRRPEVAQLAATTNQVVGNQLAHYRNLFTTEYNSAIIYFGGDYYQRERVSVYGVPGFGTNLGRIVGNGNNMIHRSVPGVAHSEPILIGRTYNAAAANPTWPQANTAVDLDNFANGGAALRAHFALYTERNPCPVACGPALAHARFDPGDTVDWTFPIATGTHDIAQSHIGRATAQFGYIFVVDPNRDWRLAGYRLNRIGNSSKRKDPPSRKSVPPDDGKKPKATPTPLLTPSVGDGANNWGATTSAAAMT